MARPNWYNDNRNRHFPFLKNTVGVATPETGPVTMRELPNDFIVDCGFVMGSESDFIEVDHNVSLMKVNRTGNVVQFTFVSDAPQLAGVPLVFTRDVAEEDYAIEHVESETGPSTSASTSVSVGIECDEPLWSGYLISGIMDSIVARLEDGEEILQEQGDAVVEPALIQNLANTILNSINLANGDRTRSTAPEGCDTLVWPHEIGIIFPGARCIQGDVRWKPGFNCVILQSGADNSITIGANQNAGEGQPCDEVSLFPGESPPLDNSTLLTGGALCRETLRSINGCGGPQLNFLVGNGVSIIPDPINHVITIDVSLGNLIICSVSDFSAVSNG